MSSSAAAGKSALPAAAPAGTNWLPLPPPPPSRPPRPPRNWTLSAMISHRLALRAVLGLPLAPVEPAVDRRPGGPWRGTARSSRPGCRRRRRRSSSACRPTGRSRPCRRLLTAMRRLQTAVPLGVCRSSGSFVKLPTSTTRLMFAMGVLLLLVRTCVRFRSAYSTVGTAATGGGAGVVVARRARPRALDVPRCQLAQHGVVDLQHANDLVERLGACCRTRRGGRCPRSSSRSRRRAGACPRRRGCATCRRASRRASRTRATSSSCRCLRESRGRAAAESRTSSQSRSSPSHGLSRPRLPVPLGTERHDDGAGSGGHCSIASCDVCTRGWPGRREGSPPIARSHAAGRSRRRLPRSRTHGWTSCANGLRRHARRWRRSRLPRLSRKARTPAAARSTSTARAAIDEMREE